MAKKFSVIIAFIYMQSLISTFVEKTDLASLAFTGAIMYGAYLHNANQTKNNTDVVEVASSAELENFILLLKKYLTPEDAEKIISRLKVKKWTDKSSSLKDYTIPLAFADLLISLIMRTNYVFYVPKIAIHAICGEKMFCYTDPKKNYPYSNKERI